MKTLIAAAMLLASTSAYAAPKGEWFLILDIWTCDTRSCADPATLYKVLERDGSYEDIVTRDTFRYPKAVPCRRPAPCQTFQGHLWPLQYS